MKPYNLLNTIVELHLNNGERLKGVLLDVEGVSLCLGTLEGVVIVKKGAVHSISNSLKHDGFQRIKDVGQILDDNGLKFYIDYE